MAGPSAGHATGTVVRAQLSILLGLARFGRGMRRFLAQPITPAQARSTILARLARRGATFLDILERAVFGYPRSPYGQLFRAAGCELGDVRALVRGDGIEGALARLRDAGVFVGFDEFKGATPAVRGSQTFDSGRAISTIRFCGPPMRRPPGAAGGRQPGP